MILHFNPDRRRKVKPAVFMERNHQTNCKKIINILKDLGGLMQAAIFFTAVKIQSRIVIFLQNKKLESLFILK
ncbi:MAG: hypothetical protein H6Q69_2344 [Firmicutes bacterium]|nr:hypothetical protein [Bacillota bacterium]